MLESQKAHPTGELDCRGIGTFNLAELFNWMTFNLAEMYTR